MLDSLTEECCVVKSTTRHHLWEKLITRETRLSPGSGPLIRPYGTPFYRQIIRRELCYSTKNNETNPICQKGYCEQQYIKQKVMAGGIDDSFHYAIGIGEIWVPAGCKFVPYNVYALVENQYSSLNNSTYTN